MGLEPEVVVARSTDEVDREAWDALVAPGRVYLTHDWLRAVERCFGLELVLFVLRAGGSVVGGTPALVVREPGGFPYHDPVGVLFGDYELDHLRQALRHGRSAAEHAEVVAALAPVVRAEAGHAAANAYPALVLTSPFGYAGDVLTHPGADRRAAVDLLLAAVEGFCRAERFGSHSLLWQSGGDDELRDALTAHGYAGVLSDLEHGLDLTGLRSLDDYLAALPYRPRRNARAEIRRFADAGLRAEHVDAPTDADLARCADLAAGQHEKYGLPVDRAALARLFAELRDGKALGAQLHVVRSPGADIAGFVLCLRSDDVLRPKFLGIDAAATGHHHAYFNLVFYHLVGHAVATGATRVEFGMGSAAAKRRRGARPVGVHAWVRLADPGAHRRLEPYAAAFDRLKRQALDTTDTTAGSGEQP